ncbi:MAG: L,D-transpeptidase [Gammaproteobacteria bacterium]|nr:L,D-transpeptidase [Gammaproteobacteria bacterium]MDH5591980.1 L,D-transpeptidase [Gammaproteobacteria bacterium]
MKTVLAINIVVGSLLFSFLHSATASETIELVLLRSEHKLMVKQGDNVLRTFKVALGSAGRKAKQREGDHATPKGQYAITKVRDSDRFHLFLQLNYPNMDDAKRALKNHLISREQYQSILEAHFFGRLPPQNTALGGAIGIHGIGRETKNKLEIHQIADWTQGCIALRNSEVEELSRFVHIGTPVIIVD